MNTVITEYANGLVFYDAECAVCAGFVDRTRGMLLRRGFHFVPMQAAWARARLGLVAGEELAEIKLLEAGGRILGGADAMIEIVRAIWWTWPVFALTELPGIRNVLRRAYQKFAANRHCFGGKCQVPAKRLTEHRKPITFYDLP